MGQCPMYKTFEDWYTMVSDAGLRHLCLLPLLRDQPRYISNGWVGYCPRAVTGLLDPSRGATTCVTVANIGPKGGRCDGLNPCNAHNKWKILSFFEEAHYV